MTATQGRDWAGAITAVMCGQAYLTSARIAGEVGPFPGYAGNAEAVPGSDPDAPRRGGRTSTAATCRPTCTRARPTAGTRPTSLAGRTGYRNAQVTVIAPTGTIGFMMDCDTTGIEP